MKNLVVKITTIMVLIAVISGFAGCRTNKTNTTTDNWELVREDREATVTITPTVGILLDTSLSTEGIKNQLRAEAERLKAEAKAAGSPVAFWEFADSNGRDTDIISALADATRCDVIYIVTDGWQDPTSKDLWGGLEKKFVHQDIYLVFPALTEHTRELLDALKSHPEAFPGSSVKVRVLNGFGGYTEKIECSEYQEKTGTAKYYDLYGHATETDAIAEEEHGHWPWWAWLLLLLLPLLLLLWWLLKRCRRREEDEEKPEVNEPLARDPDKVAPLPEGRVSRIGEEPTSSPATPTVSATPPLPEAIPAPAPVPAAQQPESCCCRCGCCRYNNRANIAQIVTAIATSVVALLAVAASAIAIWEHLL